jgi:hypothetical protein
VERAIAQLQSALELPAGAISRSSQAPMLSGSDVALRWQGGRADIDLHAGRIRAVLNGGGSSASGAEASTSSVGPGASSSSGAPGGSGTTDSAQASPEIPLAYWKLDQEADRMTALLGWDRAALQTQGFTLSDSKMVDRGTAGTYYQKTWLGHDALGVLNGGVIEVGIDVSDGSLRSFLFNPGPTTPLDMSEIITQPEAIATAAQAAAVSPIPTPDAPGGGPTTTETTVTRETTSATLIHTDKARITGGREMLVWVVKVAGDSAADRPSAAVYLDAANGDVLAVIVGG